MTIENKTNEEVNTKGEVTYSSEELFIGMGLTFALLGGTYIFGKINGSRQAKRVEKNYIKGFKDGVKVNPTAE